MGTKQQINFRKGIYNTLQLIRFNESDLIKSDCTQAIPIYSTRVESFSPATSSHGDIWLTHRVFLTPARVDCDLRNHLTKLTAG